MNIIRYGRSPVAGGPEPRKHREGHHRSIREPPRRMIRVGSPYEEMTLCSDRP
jgi:hypothetical protein